jgi:pimeloyl-ACP methyl ester carboxylesterase
MGILNMKKEKMYILHGWTYSTEKWTPFVNELKKSGINVVVLKIPGLTASIDRVWNIEDYVLWLDDTLKHEKVKVVLCGHSNGGLISLSYALKYPDKVEKLILMDSTGIYHKELSIRIKRWILQTAAKIGKKFTSSHIAKRLIYKIARAHDYENADPIMKKTMVSLIKTDLLEKFNQINIPTLIIWGERDSVTPLNDGKIMRERIKNSKLFTIKNARHSPQITHPKDTARIIIENI